MQAESRTMANTSGLGGKFGSPVMNFHTNTRRSRFGRFREDIGTALKSESEGGTGAAAKLWKWCDMETDKYA